MPHNESLSERNLDEQDETPSKLKKVRSAAVTAGIFGIPAVMAVGGTYYSFRIARLQLETAKLANEAAKAALNK